MAHLFLYFYFVVAPYKGPIACKAKTHHSKLKHHMFATHEDAVGNIVLNNRIINYYPALFVQVFHFVLQDMVVLQIHPPQLEFLLKDLVRKTEHALMAAKRITFLKVTVLYYYAIHLYYYAVHLYYYAIHLYYYTIHLYYYNTTFMLLYYIFT